MGMGSSTWYTYITSTQIVRRIAQSDLRDVSGGAQVLDDILHIKGGDKTPADIRDVTRSR